MFTQISEKDEFAHILAEKTKRRVINIRVDQAKSIDRFNKDDVMIADLSGKLEPAEASMLAAAKKQNATLILRNTDETTMAQQGFIGIKGKTVVIKNADDGRSQQIILDPDDLAVEQSEEEVWTEPSELTKEELERRADIQGLGEIGKVPLSRVTKVEKIEVGEQAYIKKIEVSDYQKLEKLHNLVEDDSFQKSVSLGKSVASKEKGYDKVSGAEAHTILTIPQIRHTTQTGSIGMSANIDIGIYAVIQPRRKKILQINSTNTIVSIFYWKNTTYEKGPFTCQGTFIHYPGKYLGSHYSEAVLPKKWVMASYAPRTENSKNTYASTTGFKIGATAKGEVGEKGKGGSLGLSYEYDEQNTIQKEIADFEVLGTRSAAFCKWDYRFSNYYSEDSMKLLFQEHFLDKHTINDLPKLSVSTLDLDNEAIYEAPPDENNAQPWTFGLQHHIARLEVTDHRHKREKYFGIWPTFYIPMNVVIHPTD